MSRVTVTPKLESVTVYNDSAQLTFYAEMPVEPASTAVAVLENMERYGNVDWSTLQFRLDPTTDAAVAANILLQNINPIHDVITEDVRADVQRVKDEIKRIEEELEMCEEEMDIQTTTTAHIDAVQAYVRNNAFKTVEGPTQPEVQYFREYLQKPADWSATGTFFATRKAAAQRKLAQLSVDKEEIMKRKAAAEMKLHRLGGDAGVRTHTKNTLEATLVVGEAVPTRRAAAGGFVCVSGAGWSPLYDLRVDYAESKLDVFYFANVRQCTSVDWEKVRLRLSTATPHTGGSPPPLWPKWNISLNPLAPKPQLFGGMSRNMHMKRAVARSEVRGFGSVQREAAPVAPVMLQADVEGGGSSSSATVYTIPGLATVRHNNVDVKVTVAHERFPAKLKFIAIPKVDSLTHLSATAVNSTDYEFISGPSKVFYGNTFVNQSQLGHVSPGEEFSVSLGTDETVTVNRSLVRRGESEKSAFFSSNKSQLQFHYAYAIKCGALASKGPVTVVVKDNYPVSDDSDVVVALKEPVPTEGREPSTTKGETVTVDEDTHEVVWEFPMNAQEKKHFNMIFTAKYPENTNTFGLE
uniref:DUF4139 domain-containing protein n=1 Tax=Angomonas deanei TaxID=59799 RepID=C6K3S3_9TRYP|nr:conserved hypothetical protein [Angomonas deanei]